MLRRFVAMAKCRSDVAMTNANAADESCSILRSSCAVRDISIRETRTTRRGVASQGVMSTSLTSRCAVAGACSWEASRLTGKCLVNRQLSLSGVSSHVAVNTVF